MLYEISTFNLSMHHFKPQDRKGSFTICPTGKVTGEKNVTKGLTIYNNQHAGTIPARQSCPVWIVGKARVPGEKQLQACTKKAKPCRHN